MKMLHAAIMLLLVCTIGCEKVWVGKRIPVPCPEMADREQCCSEGWSGELAEYPKESTVAISLMVWETTEWLENAFTTILTSDIFEYSDPTFVVYFTCTDCQRQRMYIESRLASVKYEFLGGQGLSGIVIPRIRIMEWAMTFNFDFLLEMHDDMLFPRKWFQPLLTHMGPNVAITMPAIVRCFDSSADDDDVEAVREKIEQLRQRGMQVCTNGLINHPWLVNISAIRRTGYYLERWHPSDGEDEEFSARIRVMFAPLQILGVGTSVVGHHVSATRKTTPIRLWKQSMEMFQEATHGVNLFEYREAWMGHSTMFHWQTLTELGWTSCWDVEEQATAIATNLEGKATCFPPRREPFMFWKRKRLPSMKVLIVVAIHNRYGYVRTMLQALYESTLPDRFHMIIIDDSTTEYDVAALVRDRLPISPDLYEILFRPAGSAPVGADAVDRFIVQYFLEHTEYQLVVALQSDLVPTQNWYTDLQELLLASPKRAVLSLYRSKAHPTMECKEGVCQMESIGAAGAVFTRVGARALFGKGVNMTGSNFDWSWSQGATQRQIPFCVPEQSIVVHIGMYGSWPNSGTEIAVRPRMQDYSPEVQTLINYYLRREQPRQDSTLKMIPRTIMQTWRSHSVPKALARLSRQWREINPEWEYHLYDDAECLTFMKTHCGSRAAAAFMSLKPGAFKADLFRYCYLYVSGGVYVDMDAEPLKAFDAWLHLKQSFVAVNERAGITGVWNGFMAAVPGLPLLWHAMWSVIRNVEQRFYPSLPVQAQGDQVWRAVLSICGPVLLGSCFRHALNLPPEASFPLEATVGAYRYLLLSQTQYNATTTRMGFDDGEAVFQVSYMGELGDTSLETSSYYNAVVQHRVYQERT